MFGPTWKIAEEREKLKKPGQNFCDNYGWKLNEKYKSKGELKNYDIFDLALNYG